MANLAIPLGLSDWEIMMTIQYMQNYQARDVVVQVNLPAGNAGARRGQLDRVFDLFDAACQPITVGVNGDGVPMLEYAEVLRTVEQSRCSYLEIFSCSKAKIVLPPVFPGAQAIKSTFGSIVVCPFAPLRDHQLPVGIWRTIVTYLRTFGRGVVLAGPIDKRLEGCAFSEGEILSTFEDPRVTLAAVATAALVVGVPGEWMWAAAGLQKQLITLYSDAVPEDRWFPYRASEFGRLVYEEARQVPAVFLAGLQSIIKSF